MPDLDLLDFDRNLVLVVLLVIAVQDLLVIHNLPCRLGDSRRDLLIHNDVAMDRSYRLPGLSIDIAQRLPGRVKPDLRLGAFKVMSIMYKLPLRANLQISRPLLSSTDACVLEKTTV